MGSEISGHWGSCHWRSSNSDRISSRHKWAVISTVRGVDLEHLSHQLEAAKQPAFRRNQIWQWLAGGAQSYEEMSNLPLELRTTLNDGVPISTLKVVSEQESRDGTIKTLFETSDGRPIEAVMMPYRDGRRSVCLSSQSGCPLTCRFCATGAMKFGRNLTAWEILDQALHFRRKGTVSHAVFMGMGEPLMNIEAVLTTCKYLPDIGITHRRTGISTVGWIPGIDSLAGAPYPVKLALSLHAPTDDLRNSIMPVNERYSLEEVLAACDRFYEQKRRRIFIEYVMLGGVNDQYIHARQLTELLDRKKHKINLIPYNPTGTEFDGSSRKAIDAFREVLETSGFEATVRLTRGQDIAAACGQLAAKSQ